MRIIDRGIVFVGQKGMDCQSCAFPGICVLPSGRWICTFRASPSKLATTGQHISATWSDDEGESWSKPFSPFAPPPIENKQGLFRGGYLTALGGHRVLATLYWVDYSDPSRPLFNDKTEGLIDSRIFLAISEDNSASWSNPRLMDTTPFNVPTPPTGPVLLLPNGNWACQFELNKSYYDTSVWQHSSVMMFSQDEGKSWADYVITSNDSENRIFYWDQRPGVLVNGTILNLFWTYDNQAVLYLNIHARESIDNGRTWSTMWDTGVAGQPAPPVSLPDERVAMVYVDRTSYPSIKMRISSDNGRTWSHETIIYQPNEIKTQTWEKKSMQDTWMEMSKFSVGLPRTALLQDGDVLVVYYAGTEADHTDIRWVRVRV